MQTGPLFLFGLLSAHCLFFHHFTYIYIRILIYTSLLFQVLQGLVYLHHERHVIHRDIKPSNLLVNHLGEVKITDFGVSAVLASSMAQRDTFVGTYNYMSVSGIPT